ncbi:MAG: insulinase family protein [Clostridiales bacterium]|nr:insulinase family protein [Clostridiales bacterium]
MFNKITLSNGVQIIAETIPFVRSIAFGIWVRNGSRNESKENNGISHFIEHMLFKGTETRSASRIADEFDAIGGQLNAYTAKEMTCYYARVLDSHFDQALDVLSDMFFNSLFSDAEIEKERNVISEEISMSEDSPEDLVTEILQQNVFPDNALAYPILGTTETISTFNHNTFVDYFLHNYRPENIVIAIAGNFSENETVKKIERYFGAFPSPEIVYKNPVYNAVYKPCFTKKEKDVEQVHMAISFPGVSLPDDETYSMTTLNVLFGGGVSSRLFQSVREKYGLVYSIYSYNSGFLDTGLFTIYAAANPNQIKPAFDVIVQEINKLRTERISSEYLERTKEQIKSNILLSLENSSSRMSSIGRAQLLLGKITSPDELIQKIDSIDIDALSRTIDSTFIFDKMSVALVGKTQNISENDFQI